MENRIFVLGSAQKHPYDLVLGSYPVHTNYESLKKVGLRLNGLDKKLGEAKMNTVEVKA